MSIQSSDRVTLGGGVTFSGEHNVLNVPFYTYVVPEPEYDGFRVIVLNPNHEVIGSQYVGDDVHPGEWESDGRLREVAASIVSRWIDEKENV